MKITMTLEQFKQISRLADFANYYIDGLEPSGEQYNSDLGDVEMGLSALSEVNRQIQFS
jgi:hypothetical protein